MTRLLDEQFVNDLLAGSLKALLEYVHRDPSLDLQIRKNYINIYFRGGNILKVEKTGADYKYHFDQKYFKDKQTDELMGMANQKYWNDYFPKAKQVMNIHFAPYGKEEREYQQLVVRENNNSSIANGTDYFIIDVEYKKSKAQFDMVAVEWLSESAKRKSPDKHPPKLMIIEMKFGDNAIKGESGLKKHENDFKKFISNESALADFKEEMVAVFKQKRKLGLIPGLLENQNDVSQFAPEVGLAFLLANHKPASKRLKHELDSLHPSDTRFIISSFMGYGIYEHSICDYDDFMNRI